jgi:CubicO group peptidase (beta-lactamase class C family)
MLHRRSAARWSFALLVLFATIASAAPAPTDPLPRARPEDVGMSSARLQRLSTVIQQYVTDGKISGAVALVARRGKLVYLESFGERDREAHSPMRTDTVFRIASQTKAIVSAAALMLAEQGKLALTDPVGKFIPEFLHTTVAVPRESGGYEVVKAKRPITIHDLLTHTSGLSYGEGIAADEWRKAGIQGWYFADRSEPVSAVVQRMAKLPFDAQPGERWIYGYSIDVLGVVVERASGMSLDEYLRTNILGPLGMDHTGFYLAPEKRDQLAAVYSATDHGIERAPTPGTMVGQGAYIDGPRVAFSGGAGLLSTAPDYARFLQMMLNGGELNGTRLLSRKTVELMTTDHLGAISVPWVGGTGFGLGFSVVKDVGARGSPGSVGEYGWGGAYHSSYWVDPKEQLVVIYLAQLIPSNDLDDHERVRMAVYQALQ